MGGCSGVFCERVGVGYFDVEWTQGATCIVLKSMGSSQYMTNAQVLTDIQSETNLELIYASCKLYPANVFYKVLSRPQISARPLLQEQLRWGVVQHIAENSR